MTDQGKIIAYLREEQLRNGLSYEQLENKTGIGHSVIQRYFTGATKKVPFSDLDLLCEAMGCDIAEIIIAFRKNEIDSERDALLRVCKVVPKSNVQIATNVLRQFLPDENK